MRKRQKNAKTYETKMYRGEAIGKSGEEKEKYRMTKGEVRRSRKASRRVALELAIKREHDN